MTYSQLQFQVISPQIYISNFEHFGIGSARFFLPLGMPHYSGSDLQPLSEEVTPSENVRNALIYVKEEKTIFAIAKALNGEDVPTPKKRGQPLKRGKINTPTKKRHQRKW